MITLKSFVLVAGWIPLFYSSISVPTASTELTISDIRSDAGKIIVQVFRTDEEYKKQTALKSFTYDKKSVLHGVLKVKCQLDTGDYGIAIIDDENGNGKLDKNVFGIPREGFGFSNFYLERMKRPLFEEFKIKVTGPGTKVLIRAKYM